MEAKKTPTRPGKTAATKPTPADRDRMVATAAYFRAQRRNFAPGNDLQDWLEAEAEVAAMLATVAGTPASRKAATAAKKVPPEPKAEAAPKAAAAPKKARPTAKRKQPKQP
jgi:hypothetical protein